MALIDAMEAIKALVGCVQADGAQVAHAILEEKQEAKLKKLTIAELGSGMLLLATDEGRKAKGAACMSPLLNDDGVYGHNRACDAVLLRKVGAEVHACYIEMKSDSPSGFENQFKSTQCFMKYLGELVKAFCGIAFVVSRERFVVFHTDSKDAARRGLKRRTQFKPNSANTPQAPDMRCVRNGDTVRFSVFF